MTMREKASRYDALQVAIRMAVQTYKETIRGYPSADIVGGNIILASQYGEKIAYQNVIRDMERWLA